MYSFNDNTKRVNVKKQYSMSIINQVDLLPESWIIDLWFSLNLPFLFVISPVLTLIHKSMFT